MTWIDYAVFVLYMCGVLGIGIFFFRKNKDRDDYYVGGRSIHASHVGLSVVATDVGGGFSIGLGGLGYVMGLSGSWLLFTGLVGAWMSAVFVIPRIKALDIKYEMLTYPDFLKVRYSKKVALVAALISGVGYLGFTGAQVLAGAKLFSGAVLNKAPFGIDPFQFSLYTIGLIIIIYTVMGGLKAVIYTDTFQWIILLFGLIFLAIPFAVSRIGGFTRLKEDLPPEFLTLTNVDAITFINWMVTIIPIWLIAMTLYQRIYACRNVKEARKAWYIAGVFEYPVMAFMGAFLGMCSSVLFPEVDPEQGLPMLIKTVLPTGIAGIVVASYFSAIMSTADSCLMASSGNFVNDLLEDNILKKMGHKKLMAVSQFVTLIIGVLAILMASQFKMVLDAILYAYSFMVSGLFIPTLGAYFWKRATSAGAFWGMISGGTFTLILMFTVEKSWFGLDPSVYGIILSTIVFVGVSLMTRKGIFEI